MLSFNWSINQAIVAFAGSVSLEERKKEGCILARDGGRQRTKGADHRKSVVGSGGDWVKFWQNEDQSNSEKEWVEFKSMGLF